MKTQLAIAISSALALGAASATAASWSDAPLQLKNTSSSKHSITGMPDQYDDQLGASFQWAKTDQYRPALGALKSEIRTQSYADHYLSSHYGLGVDKGDNSARLLSLSDYGRGAIVAKYGQTLHGIPVFNRHVNVMMDQEMNLVASSGGFAATAPAVTLHYGSEHAALNYATLDLVGAESLEGQGAPLPGGYTGWQSQLRSEDYRFSTLPRTKKVWFEEQGKLRAAYFVEVALTSISSTERQNYSYVIDATTGKVLFKHDQIAHSGEFGYRVYAHDSGMPWDGPHGNVIPATSADQQDAAAYLDAPLVTLAHGPISTQDPWLSEDALVTKGNNVHAYADVAAPDGFSEGDVEAEVTATQTFDYAYNTNEPEHSTNNRKAAIVNLFYLNNYLHDEFYDHGFDEASGNAQQSNYGRGGVEGDPLHVEVQDYSGTNNANMSTPADGYSPTMQMYLFDSKDASVGKDFGVVASADSVSGLLNSSQMAGFGPQSFDLTGNAKIINDGVGEGRDGCEATSQDLTGVIAIIDRGSCAFTDKVLFAQNAGAIAAIVVNNQDDGTPAPMGGTDENVTIPSMGLSFADGAKLYSVIDNGESLSLRLYGSRAMKGSSWDNGIVAHEWGHYITNRLIGNGSGLTNQQGRSMGEGWGDFHALLMLSDATDSDLPGNELFQKAYAATSYVAGFYSGIRNFPYSSDMKVNPLTFANVTLGNGTRADRNGAAEVHDAGEPWAAMLWDSYVALINDERYGFDEARNRMKSYLVASYKMTPNAPTYTEARDALLAAAYANDPQDYQLILSAFARRGMGLGAVSPARDSTTHEGVVESYKTQYSSVEVTSHQIETDFEGLTNGYCTKDGILDKGETGTVKFTVRNRGSEAFDELKAKVSVVGDQQVSFSNGGEVIFKDLGITGTANSSVLEFTLDEVGIEDTLTFSLSFDGLAEETVAVDYEYNTTVNMGYISKPLVGGSALSDMENSTGLANLQEQVLSGGANAVNTVVLDRTFADQLPVGEQYLLIKNNPFASDVAAQTQPFTVGSEGDFTVSWFQYFIIEEGWDGGVVEISVNGGEWQDVVDAGGVFTGSGYVGELNELLPERQVFTGNQGGDEGVNFGTSLNGQQVQLRFRLVSDDFAAGYGWMIDDLQINNAATPVFFDLVSGDTIACDNRLPHVDAFVSSTSVSSGDAVELTASAVDANAGDTLTYTWQQTAGTQVVLTGADSVEASFVAPTLSSAETLTFKVTVNDGTGSVEKEVSVTVAATAPVQGSGSSSSGAFAAWLMALLPFAFWRRRRQ